MKIVVAMDKFKGCLTAPEAGDIVRRGLLAVQPDLRVLVKPMADGGDGTAAVLHASLGGEWIAVRVMGPLPERPGRSRYLYIAPENLAVVEMAAASGLALLEPAQRNPLQTTTYGTGQLIAHAIRRGAKKILLGLGGSATVDGGVGAAMALGWKFLDAHGKPVGHGGAALERIASIRPPQTRFPVIEVLCDVDNPLCGEHGAARVFGPQKGATPAMVERLDAGLKHLADLVRTQLGTDIAHLPGTGTAGGLAAGAMAFLGARLVPGVETVMRATGFRRAVRDADWVITGEGCFDEQSLRGKVVAGVAAQGRAAGARVAVIAGCVQLPEQLWRDAGISFVSPLQQPGMALAEAIARAPALLETAARKFAATYLTSGGNTTKVGPWP